MKVIKAAAVQLSPALYSREGTVGRTHLRSTTVDFATLLDQQQRSALNRSCPKCRCGTLHVVAHSWFGQPIVMPAVPHPVIVDSS